MLWLVRTATRSQPLRAVVYCGDRGVAHVPFVESAHARHVVLDLVVCICRGGSFLQRSVPAQCLAIDDKISPPSRERAGGPRAAVREAENVAGIGEGDAFGPGLFMRRSTVEDHGVLAAETSQSRCGRNQRQSAECRGSKKIHRFLPKNDGPNRSAAPKQPRRACLSKHHAASIGAPAPRVRRTAVFYSRQPGLRGGPRPAPRMLLPCAAQAPFARLASAHSLRSCFCSDSDPSSWLRGYPSAWSTSRISPMPL